MRKVCLLPDDEQLRDTGQDWLIILLSTQSRAEGEGLTPDVESMVLEKQHYLWERSRADCRVG
jgi:hypothetical protein